MKNPVMVLLLASMALAQNPPAGTQQPGATAPSSSAQAPSAPAQQRKVIQDPNEYNAYVAALNTTDPAKKAQMMESFLQTYPNSVMKQDGLEILLNAYQQLNNTALMKTVAQRLLQVDANNLTALAVLSYLDRNQAQSGGADAPALFQEAGQLGNRGLQALDQATKPEGVSDQQWNTMQTSFRVIFLGSVGQAALQAKDYTAAQQALKEAVTLQPNDVNNIYQLSLAYLLPKPPVVDGLFWLAKAANSVPNLKEYAKNQYVRYHGSEEGFDALLAEARQQPTIPAGFTVAPAPSPADQAAELLKKGSPDKLSFAEWQFILSNGNKDASDQVWNVIKGKQVQLVADVIEASPTSLRLAGTIDDIKANKPDITLNLKEPLPAARLPKPGAELTVQGAPSDYTATADSFNMIFTDGIVVKGLPEAATKPSAGRRR